MSLSILIIDLSILVSLLVVGVPVSMCFVWATLFIFYFSDVTSYTFLISAGFSRSSSIVLVALPLFVIAGVIMSQGGIASRLLRLAETWVGKYKGGLGMVVVLTCAVFGAISGMATSAVAAIGEVMIPRMVARGYDRGYAASLVANSSVLALLIPPSASMILYGWVSGTSITAAFLAPVLPGFILITLFMVWNAVLTKSMPITMPAHPVPVRRPGERIREIFKVWKAGSLALMMPVIILGTIYGGIATPTEAAGIAVVYAIVISLMVYRELSFKGMIASFVRSGKITGALMMLVFFASVYSRILTIEDLPQLILTSFLAISENKIVLLLLMNVFLLIVGMLMDDASGILLATPLLMPLTQHLGVDPIHFAAIIATNLGMGLITPPTAPILYFAGLIGESSLSDMLKPTMVFLLLAYLPVVLLTTFIPELAVWLPSAILG